MSPSTPPQRPRIAVVLGGSQGIGAAVASRLVSSGYCTIVVARTAETLDATSARIDPSGQRAVPVVCDVTDADAGQRIAASALESFGGLPTSIVLSSSVFVAGRFLDMDHDQVGDVFDANVLGPFRVIRHLLEQTTLAPECGVADAPPGTVVVINSTAGLQMNFDSAVYSASEIAVRALTDALRREINPRGIRVTSIFPGRADTQILQQVLEDENAEFVADHALDPADVADTVMIALSTAPLAEITELVVRPVLRPRRRSTEEVRPSRGR